MSKKDYNYGKSIISSEDETKHNELYNDDHHDDGGDYDALNDETFGDAIDDGNDWETEHEKLAAFVVSRDVKNRDDRLSDNTKDRVKSHEHSDLRYHHYHRDVQRDEHKDRDAFDINEIMEKTINNLVLDDDDDDLKYHDDDGNGLNDPAIMTFSRGTRKKVQLSSSSSSPPPPAFLEYEEYSASPKTTSIWSAMNEPIVPQTQSLGNYGPNIRTLQDIERDLLNKNNEQLISTIKRPIKAEDLESSLINSAITSEMPQKTERNDIGWSPFGPSAVLPEILPNGRLNNNESPIRTSDLSQSSASMIPSAINADDLEKEMFIKPIMKAQTLDEIERQLLPNRVKSPIVTSTETKSQTPPSNAQLTVHNNPRFVPQMRMRPVIPNFYPPQIQNHMRPHLVQRPLFNRPPMIPFIPGFTRPPIGRGFYPHPLFPGSQRLYPIPLNSRPIMHPFLQQHNKLLQQQLLFQQQYNRHYQRQTQHRYSESSDNDDEYAGLMTQREKEWLIKNQQMQVELKDPYVDDYYYVTYTSRKIAAAAAAADRANKTSPSLLLPERPKQAVELSSSPTAKYVPIQFEGSLGKIQVSNVNCPRKLLDCGVNKHSGDSSVVSDNSDDIKLQSKGEVSKFRKLLLQIERLYVVLLNIDDEDKRIGALPNDARKPHMDTRNQLCDKLFKGLTNETHEKINLEIVQIKKGLALLFRSLSYLSDVKQRAVIISDLLNATNFKQYVIKPKDRLDYGKMMINAIHNINDHETLLFIVIGINDIPAIIKSECGQKVIESIITQFENLEVNDNDIKAKWAIFVNHVLDDADDIQNMRKFCSNHLIKLGV